MRISDWSSDVCSSDLNRRSTGRRRPEEAEGEKLSRKRTRRDLLGCRHWLRPRAAVRGLSVAQAGEAGSKPQREEERCTRARCRREAEYSKKRRTARLPAEIRTTRLMPGRHGLRRSEKKQE